LSLTTQQITKLNLIISLADKLLAQDKLDRLKPERYTGGSACSQARYQFRLYLYAVLAGCPVRRVELSVKADVQYDDR
jgi:hypothetical protein